MDGMFEKKKKLNTYYIYYYHYKQEVYVVLSKVRDGQTNIVFGYFVV
jgi:hypothetical protein